MEPKKKEGKKTVINRGKKVAIRSVELKELFEASNEAFKLYEKERMTFNLEPHPQDADIKEGIRDIKKKGLIELNYLQLSQFKKILETYIVVLFRDGKTENVTGEGTAAKVIKDKVGEAIESLKTIK